MQDKDRMSNPSKLKEDSRDLSSKFNNNARLKAIASSSVVKNTITTGTLTKTMKLTAIATA